MMKPYQPKNSKPFDSNTPRFDYRKQHGKHNGHLGPGAYTKHYEEVEELKMAEIKRTGTINSKYMPAIGTENRQKFSLFGQITKQGHDSSLGPGSYDPHTANGIASKKVFNASLQKPSPRLNANPSGLGQSSLSTKLSPRSSQGQSYLDFK